MIKTILALALLCASPALASPCHSVRDYDKRLACLAEEQGSPEGVLLHPRLGRQGGLSEEGQAGAEAPHPLTDPADPIRPKRVPCGTDRRIGMAPAWGEGRASQNQQKS